MAGEKQFRCGATVQRELQMQHRCSTLLPAFLIQISGYKTFVLAQGRFSDNPAPRMKSRIF